jgi:hypothetical protein
LQNHGTGHYLPIVVLAKPWHWSLSTYCGVGKTMALVIIYLLRCLQNHGTGHYLPTAVLAKPWHLSLSTYCGVGKTIALVIMY